MKLIEKNNRRFFGFTFFLLLIGSLLFYGTISWVFRQELDEQLQHDKARVVALIQANQKLVQLSPIIEVHPINAPSQITTEVKDTMLFDVIEGEEEPFRQLVLDTLIQGKAFRIIIRSSLVESEDILFAIALSTFILFIGLFIGLYWLNRQQIMDLWQPFYANLAAIRTFSLRQPKTIDFLESDIAEFQELKNVLEELTTKVQTDYSNLKAFTENASHEIQTPLAIIRSKIEEMLADRDFNETQIDSIQEIYQSANRLSRLNRKLLLLTKIENHQFEDEREISLNQLIEREVVLLSDLIEERGLKIQKEIGANLRIYMSEVMAEVMVKNLLENAIKHSQIKEVLSIKIQADEITFANPGKQALAEPEKLFTRFYRRNGHSLGLGLAIVKQIADTNGFRLAYQFESGRHQFSVFFQIQDRFTA